TMLTGCFNRESPATTKGARAPRKSTLYAQRKAGEKVRAQAELARAEECRLEEERQRNLLWQQQWADQQRATSNSTALANTQAQIAAMKERERRERQA